MSECLPSAPKSAEYLKLRLITAKAKNIEAKSDRPESTAKFFENLMSENTDKQMKRFDES